MGVGGEDWGLRGLGLNWQDGHEIRGTAAQQHGLLLMGGANSSYVASAGTIRLHRSHIVGSPSPPMTPPTMAPIGAEDEEDDGGGVDAAVTVPSSGGGGGASRG